MQETSLASKKENKKIGTVNGDDKGSTINSPCEEVCYQKEFINLVPEIVWPLTIMLIVLVFRRKLVTIFDVLTGLLNETDSLEYNGAKWVRLKMDKISEKANVDEVIPEITGEYYIDEENEQIRYKSLASLRYEDFVENTVERLDIDKIYDLAQKHPRSAVLEAWSIFEIFSKTYIEKKDLSEKPLNSRNNIELLFKHGVLSKEQRLIANEMRKIRNTVAHSQIKVNRKTANEYVTTAFRLAALISKKFYQS